MHKATSLYFVLILAISVASDAASPVSAIAGTTTAPVTALAYRPDGKLLAAAGNREVVLIDVASGDVVARLPGQGQKITALAFNRSGDRLAVASGSPSVSGEVRIYTMDAKSSPSSLDGAKPAHTVAAHKDLIHDLAFSPDGKSLATCSYDRLVKLWDAATAKEIRTLKDHSDAVYGVAFNPDGKLLASCSADRAVKVWDLATGARLYTLSESSDWLYSVAWSPQGNRLAAAGVDKSIRVWEVSASGGKLVLSAFAHEGPIVRLIYAADGKTLYSLSEDRTTKSWDAARLVERKVYTRQPDTVLALAVGPPLALPTAKPKEAQPARRRAARQAAAAMPPKQSQLALGRYDGVLVLLDAETGKVKSEPLPVKPKPPQVAKLIPVGGPRGISVRIVFEGSHLAEAAEITSSYPGVVARIVETSRQKDGKRLEADVTFPAQTAAGMHQLTLKNAAGPSAAQNFYVDPFPSIAEKAGNDSVTAAQSVNLPATFIGAADQAGDLDCFRFQAVAGQEIGVQAITAPVGSKLEPILRLTDANGGVLMERTDGILGFHCDKPGTYVLSIRDREFRGGEGFHYRLHVGDIPVVTAVFPLGLQRGSEAQVRLDGVHLPAKIVPMKVAKDAAIGAQLPIVVNSPKGVPAGTLAVTVGEFPEIVSSDHASQTPVIPVPGVANGIIDRPGAIQTWRFAAKKGEKLVLEVHAARLGTPLDSYIEILDGKGQSLPLATLRCLTKTETVLRDHDANAAGIRLDSCAGMAMRDYVLIGSEILRVRTLPNYADEDCQFFAAGGRRTGQFGTTPAHHALGTPLYKVEVHPPGMTFPPNGFPVFTLYHRNDDGGPNYGKDSFLLFDPPAHGDYQVRIGDSRGLGELSAAYRLTVRPPRPSYNVSFNPTTPAVPKGGSAPVTVTVDRIDGFDGPVDVRLENLPPGFAAPSATIHPDDISATLGVTVEPTAAAPMKAGPIKLIAKAIVGAGPDGKPIELVREAMGGAPRIKDSGDILAATTSSELVIQPGGTAKITVNIERRNDFKGRVPVETRGLPYGVRLLNVGLNGVLITEAETSRTYTIYAEPWVEPMTHPFVVVARAESKGGAEHPAKPMVVKVVPK